MFWFCLLVLSRHVFSHSMPGGFGGGGDCGGNGSNGGGGLGGVVAQNLKPVPAVPSLLAWNFNEQVDPAITFSPQSNPERYSVPLIALSVLQNFSVVPWPSLISR